jgi:hypothetical protein
MSKPDNWNAHKNEIFKRFKSAKINTSKNLIDSAFSELINAGYIVLKTPMQRLDNGQIRFAGKEYVFHDEPQLQKGENLPTTGNYGESRNPDIGNLGESEKVAHLINTDLIINTNNITNTDINNKESTDFKKSASTSKKEKKYNYDYTFPINFDDELKATFEIFLKYKIDKKQAYKENTSVQILINRISKYIDQYDAKLLNELILDCIGNNYQGIIFDKLPKMQEEKIKFLNNKTLKNELNNSEQQQAIRRQSATNIAENALRIYYERREHEENLTKQMLSNKDINS